jgi:hypothetical protein
VSRHDDAVKRLRADTGGVIRKVVAMKVWCPFGVCCADEVGARRSWTSECFREVHMIKILLKYECTLLFSVDEVDLSKLERRGQAEIVLTL